MITFPDVLVLFDEGESSGGTEGSLLNHMAFRVRSLEIPVPTVWFAQFKRAKACVECVGCGVIRWLRHLAAAIGGHSA